MKNNFGKQASLGSTLNKMLQNILLGLCCVATLAAGETHSKPSPHSSRVEQAAKRSKIPLADTDDGLAVISAALDSRTRLDARSDCSHLVHDIYERAGLLYHYADSSQLYDGNASFHRVIHPQAGDLVVWPGHVGIMVNPAQRTFFSALSNGLDVDSYDTVYWRGRGEPHFLRFVKRRAH